MNRPLAVHLIVARELVKDIIKIFSDVYFLLKYFRNIQENIDPLHTEEGSNFITLPSIICQISMKYRRGNYITLHTILSTTHKQNIIRRATNAIFMR